MLTHSQIWAAIDALASRFDLSASGLAKKAGLDPTSFNKSKRKTADGKERWPSTESLAKILQATRTSLDDFVHLVESEGDDDDYYLQLSSIGANSLVVNVDGFGEEQGSAFPVSQSVIGAPVSGFNDEDAFVYQLHDDVMEPFYRAGDKIIASPNADIRAGDRVLICFTDGKVILAVLESRDDKQVEVLKLEYGIEKASIVISKVATIAKVLWVSQS